MKSREFKKIITQLWEDMFFSHRGNGLIVDNLMKPIDNLRREVKKTASKELREVAKKLEEKQEKSSKKSRKNGSWKIR